MLEPLPAPNAVPASTARTARRPGTRPSHLPMEVMARAASPEWSTSSPISTNSGRAMNAKVPMLVKLLRAMAWTAPGPTST